MNQAAEKLEILPIPAFVDNYLWLLCRGDQAVVIDPGDATPVEQALADRGLRLSAILITHHHPDHIGGLKALTARRPDIALFGPQGEADKIRQMTHPLLDGDQVELLGRTFQVMEVPGHTLGHIAYFSPATDTEPDLLFCGDTLFSAGCGRLFEGTPAQMLKSLDRLAALPPETAVYCTHEYTMANLAFALAVEPQNTDLRAYVDQVKQWRAANQPSLPSNLRLERAINPFLRADQADVQCAATAFNGAALDERTAVFAALRRWKDNFKPPAAL